MKIDFRKFTETATTPTKATDGSAGFDLYVDTDVDVWVKPHTTVLLQTNIAMEIPEGYFGAVFARSGLSTKVGLRPSTCVSVIDSDYRGSIGLPIHNDTNEIKKIKAHERVAQIVFLECPKFELNEVDYFKKETNRGTGGFGHSGSL